MKFLGIVALRVPGDSPVGGAGRLYFPIFTVKNIKS